MANANAEASRRLIEEGFNQGRLEVVDELAAEDFINHDPADGGDFRGRQAAKDQIAAYRSAFPDLRLTIEDVIASEDKVVLRWTSTGTHEGELMGLAPTGQRASVSGLTIDRFGPDGKVAESWNNWDVLGLMRQLGAAPPPGSMGEKVGIQLQRFAARRQRRKTGATA